MKPLEVLPVPGLPEIRPGDDLAAMIAEKASLRAGDILVVAQKVVSKAEGRIRELSEVQPGDSALQIAAELSGDARMVQVVLEESVRIVRQGRSLIVETRHGYVCANAGVDRSNVEGDRVALLPDDPDASADGLRRRLLELAGVEVGVIVSDTFGRPWRMGIVNVALGVSGLPALIDHRGRPDDFGRNMTATLVAVADEMAAAAGLVMGKTDRLPVVVIRGYTSAEPNGTGGALIRPAAEDLFR